MRKHLLGASFAALLAPTLAFAETPATDPQGASTVSASAPRSSPVESTTHPDWGIVLAGTIVFSGGWLATGLGTTIVCATSTCADVTPPIAWVPLAGPPVILGLFADDGIAGSQVAGLVIGETIQVAGFVTMMVGLAVQVEDGAPARTQALHVLPWADDDGGGVYVGGAF